MKKKIVDFWHHEYKYMLSAFFIPSIILFGVYASMGIYWGSDRSVLASDAFSQFSNFHASFNNVLHGKQNIFFTWNASLGLNYFALVAYYLGGIFTPLVFFFDNSQIPDVLYLLTLLKVGFGGLSFWIYAKNTFRIPRWSHVALSVSYALMSFSIAHSELIMWLDTFVYLPLIILGINRLMDLRKPACLFVFYLILFISNFYMGFMVGIFSVLYFLARLITKFKVYKTSIIPYVITSLLAGCSSMIMILPTILDLRSNGEELTKISSIKTEATAFWDILMKNMIGVFDTTKYGSIPFIYIGLFPLVLCIFYFVNKQIPLKNKLAYASIFIILISSFYITPLNLFWHGMHAPNMFLFRYSFLFSFLVIMLAGYGWESFKQSDLGYLAGSIIMLLAVFATGKFMTFGKTYTYISEDSFYITLLFLTLYLIAIVFYQLKHIPINKLAVLLLLLMSAEATINTSGMINGILQDWNYASRSLYSTPYSDYKDIVSKVQANASEGFYRMENLDPVSSNDSLNYGFSGVSLFSSIRNRNSSTLLDELGFRSRGTNLNIRYPNNTLLMDALVGIKYNISKSNPNKFGYKEIEKNKSYQAYENTNSLPLGIMTDSDIYKLKLPKNDNLGSQTLLYNHLAQSTNNYYSFAQPLLVSSENTEIIHKNNNQVTYKEKTSNVAKELTWEITVPARTQAYLSLFPTDFSELESSTATLSVNGQSNSSQINITGQYYNLGYYPEDTLVTFTVSFYGTKSVSFIDPSVVFMDIDKFKQDTTKIQRDGVDFSYTGRTVTAEIIADKDGVLLTTIPYDKGWTAYVDGEKVKIEPFKDAFLAIPIKEGTHKIKFSFLPQGFKTGVICFVLGISFFLVYNYIYLKKKEASHKKTKRKKRNTRNRYS